jgi:hypothetical protein
MDRREYFSCAPGESSGGSVAALMPDCVSGEVTGGTVLDAQVCRFADEGLA